MIISKEDVAERIRSSFANAHLEQDEEVLARRMREYDPEVEEYQAYFSNKDWHDIVPKDCIYYRSALFFLSDHAFCVFLPAFLLACLDEDLNHYIDLNFFLDPCQPLVRETVRRRANLLTAEQREAVRQWLLYQRSLDDFAFTAADGRKEFCEYWNIDWQPVATSP